MTSKSVMRDYLSQDSIEKLGAECQLKTMFTKNKHYLSD